MACSDPLELTIIAPGKRRVVEPAMPKVYAVVTYRLISDPAKLAAYAKLAGPAVAPFGARFLARGDAVVAREQA
jgi:hypothetical protein